MNHFLAQDGIYFNIYLTIKIISFTDLDSFIEMDSLEAFEDGLGQKN